MASNILAILFCSIGTFFFIAGTTGLLRCPDLYSRLHPATKCDTLGSCSIVLALSIHLGLDLTVFKLIAIVFLLLLTSAPSGHAIGRCALMTGVVPWHKQGVEPIPEGGLKWTGR